MNTKPPSKDTPPGLEQASGVDDVEDQDALSSVDDPAGRWTVEEQPMFPSNESLGIDDVLMADLDDIAGELTSEPFTTASVSMLRRDLRLAVRSALGFSITLTVPGAAGVAVAINVFDEPLHPDQIADSITVPLPSRDDDSTASITFYADQPDALASLRDCFAEALDLPSSTLITTPTSRAVINPGIVGLGQFTDVHRSIGILLSRGHTLESAAVELVRQSHLTAGGLEIAARTLVREASLNS